MMNHPIDCRFCLANALLKDAPIFSNTGFYVLSSLGPDRANSLMIIPVRHVLEPFELTAEDWQHMPSALAFARDYLARAKPDGYTIGWNVGTAAGQHVAHAHMHVIARFDTGPDAGFGLHAGLSALKTR